MACSVSKDVAQGLECCCCCFVCVKEHIEGEAAKEHKAITLALVGDGVHKRCRVAEDGEVFILRLHSENSYAMQR